MIDLSAAVQRLIQTPGKFLGRTPTRPRSDYFPGRPADAPDPVRAAKLPKGVEGKSLGRHRKAK